MADKFILRGIPKAPATDEAVDVTIEIDANGVLKVTATSVGRPNQEKSITIKRDKMINLSPQEIQELANQRSFEREREERRNLND